MEQDARAGFGRGQHLAGIGGLAGKELLLRGLALDDLVERGALDRGDIDHVLHQARVGQHQRDAAATVVGLAHRVADERFEIACGIRLAGRAFPGAGHLAAMNGHRLELLVQPAYAESRQVARDAVAAQFPFEAEAKHSAHNSANTRLSRNYSSPVCSLAYALRRLILASICLPNSR